MFHLPKKYKEKNHFIFRSSDDLKSVCNAPRDGNGVYIVRILSDESVIYIGSSGKMQNNGSMKTREGGLYGRIVNGKQFGDRRSVSWPRQMKKEKLESLKVQWYKTFTTEIKDIPAYVEAVLIQEFYNHYKRLPRWNREF